MKRLLLLTLPWVAGLALLVAVQPERDSVAGLQPFPSRLQSEIHAIRDRAAAIRELPVNRHIEEGFISQADLTRLFKETIEGLGDDYKASLSSRTEAMKLMHMIGPNDDLEELASSTQGTAGIAGVYFPAKKSLLVVGKPDSIRFSQEFILAHEYIHSFQDQRFGLDGILIPGATPFSEDPIIAQCVVEGDATAGAQAYMEEYHGPNWQRRVLAETLASQGFGGNTSTSSLTIAGVARYVLFLYNDCAKFIEAVHDRDGWRGVDALYSRLPQSTEQILHPERYLTGQLPKDVPELDLVPVLGAGWETQSTDSFGELDLLAYMFGLTLDDNAARRAADGWGGGRITVYGNNTTYTAETLVHIRLSWDSADAMAEFRTEYHRALTRPGASIIPSASLRQIDASRPVWQWQASFRDLGYTRWNDATSTTDIVLTTSDSALKAVQTDLEKQEGTSSVPAR